jgi:hypothetical protein
VRLESSDRGGKMSLATARGAVDKIEVRATMRLPMATAMIAQVGTAPRAV